MTEPHSYDYDDVLAAVVTLIRTDSDAAGKELRRLRQWEGHARLARKRVEQIWAGWDSVSLSTRKVFHEHGLARFLVRPGEDDHAWIRRLWSEPT